MTPTSTLFGGMGGCGVDSWCVENTAVTSSSRKVKFFFRKNFSFWLPFAELASERDVDGQRGLPATQVRGEADSQGFEAHPVLVPRRQERPPQDGGSPRHRARHQRHLLWPRQPGKITSHSAGHVIVLGYETA